MRMTTVAATAALLAGAATGAGAASLADAPRNLFKPLPASAPAKDAKPFQCGAVPVPVTDLSFGSRYKPGDKSRSEIDEDASKATTEALRPVDRFVDEISRMANLAYAPTTPQEDRVAAALCVLKWVDGWASGGALTRLESDTAKMSVASRLSGIALAYVQARNVEGVSAGSPIAAPWMQGVMDGVISFFEEEAGKMTRTNNHRAWAGLAAASVGMATDTRSTFEWGLSSLDAVACEADEDGALLQEMKRGQRALHYQIYAVSPLVATAAIAEAAGEEGFARCGGSLARIVDFTVAAIADPSVVAEKAGRDQFGPDTKAGRIEPYELAWGDVYLARHRNAALEALVEPIRATTFSKIGGNTTLMYKGSVEDHPNEDPGKDEARKVDAIGGARPRS